MLCYWDFSTQIYSSAKVTERINWAALCLSSCCSPDNLHCSVRHPDSSEVLRPQLACMQNILKHFPDDRSQFPIWWLETSIIQALGNAQLVSLGRVAMKISALHYGQVAAAAGGSAGMKCVTNPAVIGHLHTNSKIEKSSPGVSWSYSTASDSSSCRVWC